MIKYLLILGLFLQFYAAEANAKTQKFAVLLGNNVGHDPAKKLNYAEDDIVKIRNVLVDLGGFEKDNIALLLGRNSKQAWDSIEQIETQLARHKRQTGSKALLLFYYSGHANGDVLELGSSSMQFSHLLNYLRASVADVRLAFLDSCLSGNIITAKGGKRGPGYKIKLTDEITAEGYAIVTSSAFDELSQESTEIRGAFFTHYLLSALRGAGDKSEDGKVTLNEAYQYAYNRTLARTSTTLGATQHPMFEYQLQGRGDIVLTQTAQSGTSITVKSPQAGRMIVLNESENNIVAELSLAANQDAYVVVRPGNYRAYLLTQDNDVRYADIRARKTDEIRLSSDEFRSVSLKTSVAKGGLFEDRRSELVHRVGLGGMWRYWALGEVYNYENAYSSYGASLHYRLQTRSGFEPGARLTWATRGDVGEAKGYHDFGIALTAGYALPVSRFILRLGVALGCEYMVHDPIDENKQGSPALNYLGLLGTEVKLTEMMFASLDLAAGGRYFAICPEGQKCRPNTIHDKEFKTVLDLQAVLSFGFKWIR